MLAILERLRQPGAIDEYERLQDGGLTEYKAWQRSTMLPQGG
jgi:hypothetical protein